MDSTQNVKKYFAQTIALAGNIAKMTEKIEMLRAMEIAGGSISGSTGAGTKSRNIRRGEDLAVEILTLQEGIAKTKATLLTHEREVKKLADTLKSPIGRAIITWRYICRLAWKDIADRAEMSEMQAMREHNAAIKEIAAAPSNARNLKCKFLVHSLSSI